MNVWFLLPLLFMVGCQAEPEITVSRGVLSLALVSNECKDQQGACRLTADQGEISLSFAEPISPLTPFRVQLDVATWSTEIESVVVDFKMAVMDMGKNRYRLLKQSEGRWQSRVVLPLCGDGGRAWLLQLQLLDVAGQRWSASVPVRMQK